MSLPIEKTESNCSTVQLMCVIEIFINFIMLTIQIESAKSNAITYSTDWCTKIWIRFRAIAWKIDKNWNEFNSIEYLNYFVFYGYGIVFQLTF